MTFFWQKLSITILNVGENVEQAIPNSLLKQFCRLLQLDYSHTLQSSIFFSI